MRYLLLYRRSLAEPRETDKHHNWKTESRWRRLSQTSSHSNSLFMVYNYTFIKYLQAMISLTYFDFVFKLFSGYLPKNLIQAIENPGCRRICSNPGIKIAKSPKLANPGDSHSQNYGFLLICKKLTRISRTSIFLIL